MNRLNLFLWVIFPYLCLTTFVVGHWWRYRVDQFNWTTRSTQLYERRMLRWGSMLFHYGLLAVIGGHVMGLLVPASLTERLGITEAQYHIVSVGAGTITGLVCLVGFLILVYRRGTVRRVSLATSRIDVITFALLAVVVILGMTETIGANLLGGGYDYRATVAIWFRGVFMFDPQPALMASAPLVYRLHALAAFLLFALWPFSRLIHAWSIPLQYLWRPYIVYRSREHAAKTEARRYHG